MGFSEKPQAEVVGMDIDLYRASTFGDGLTDVPNTDSNV
jgi:hypothetical protein